MFERLSSGYVDSFSGNNNGVTPNFDTYANNGLKFTNFYANGQRSHAGITALMTGITQPHVMPPLGEGLELCKLSYLGQLAAQNGYDTLAIQSSNRGSFKVDAIMNLAGFRQYYGAEDLPKTGDEVGALNFGVYDGDMFRFMHEKPTTLKEPFISFAFTVLDDFHIPLIIYASNLLPSKTIGKVGSQADIFPTIIHLLGWSNQFTSLSQSLLDDEAQERFAFLRVGSIIGIITKKGIN